MAKKQTLDWTLAPAPESTDYVKINAQYKLFINGKWQKPNRGQRAGIIKWTGAMIPPLDADHC
ncbi:MAG TPA: hypothetical protein PLB89_00440 [Flavobacteriales bacterium]|nr:hypothetical protein [Flavobacteriales bacterium]